MNISRIRLERSLRPKTGRVIVFPFFEEKLPSSPLFLENILGCIDISGQDIDSFLRFLVKRKFSGKGGEVLYFSNSEHILLAIGVGRQSDVTPEGFRRIGASLWPTLKLLKATDVAFVDRDCSVPVQERVLAFVEGCCLVSYEFTKYVTKSSHFVLDTLSVVSPYGGKSLSDAFTEAVEICRIVCIVRDLVNDPSEELSPVTFAKEVSHLAKLFGCTAKILTQEQIAKKGMTLIDTVGRASVHPNRFVELQYRGAGVPDSSLPIVLVGKGVTFDTGGVNLKPSVGGFLEEMHTDMAGAATVLGAVLGAAVAKLPIAVTAVMPLAENALGGDAYKPGSVLRSYAGKTVEIVNTDAEGRLLLADALWYAVQDIKAKVVIDVATLTGACMIALGTPCAGLVSNDEKLVEQLRGSGDRTYERVWPLPLYEEYREDVTSTIADVRNMGKLGGGRFAGAITAATFLEHFIQKDTRWAHIDIAGTATHSHAHHYFGPGATGFGVRLLVDFLRNF